MMFYQNNIWIIMTVIIVYWMDIYLYINIDSMFHSIKYNVSYYDFVI